jgi:hypothetical protein
MEEWKDIAGYEGLYQVSNLGRVKTLERVRVGTNPYETGYTRCYKEKVLKPLTGRNNYFAVNLYNDGFSKTYDIHKLVASAFIPPVENKPEIDHINRDCYDNRLENLRWATRSEQNINRNVPLPKKSGEKHITWDTRDERYTVKIKRDGKYLINKGFKLLEDAVAARDAFLATL